MKFKITWHLPKNSGQEPGYFWKVTSKEDPELEIWAKECVFNLHSKTGPNHIECEGNVKNNDIEGIVTFYE